MQTLCRCCNMHKYNACNLQRRVYIHTSTDKLNRTKRLDAYCISHLPPSSFHKQTKHPSLAAQCREKTWQPLRKYSNSFFIVNHWRAADEKISNVAPRCQCARLNIDILLSDGSNACGRMMFFRQTNSSSSAKSVCCVRKTTENYSALKRTPCKHHNS